MAIKTPFSGPLDHGERKVSTYQVKTRSQNKLRKTTITTGSIKAEAREIALPG
jgi:hypothetical protein